MFPKYPKDQFNQIQLTAFSDVFRIFTKMSNIFLDELFERDTLFVARTTSVTLSTLY